MKIISGILPLLAMLPLLSTTSLLAATKEYNLVVDRQPVTVESKTHRKITINNTIPGPVLEFTEGETAVITVTNRLQEPTSTHWHGILLPGKMDGVKGANGFPGIPAGETFTYRFPVRQNGTYWYHSHTGGQEQDGQYGALVIHPQKETIKADRDYVVLLSDFHPKDGHALLADLKRSAEYYQYNRYTLADFFRDIQADGFATTWRTAREWGQMRMLRTDLADVTGYTFLMNGHTPQQNWTGLFTPGQTVRLRLVNGSAMTFLDLRIPGLAMTVIAADGQPTEPVTVQELRLGVAEIYDVLVTPPDNKAYTLVAESLDRTGLALGTLAPRAGMKGAPPAQRPRAELTMADMGTGGHAAHSMPAMNHAAMEHAMPQDMNHAAMGHHAMPAGDVPGSGWAKTGAPADSKVLSYRDLKYSGKGDSRPPAREITVNLDGNMERYIWMLDGRKHDSAAPIFLQYGERVRITFVNNTMMAHPMHLHGLFFQVENGQPPEKMPRKNVVIVPPGGRQSVLLTADEPGEWMIHCHLLYHMMAGMMNRIIIGEKGADVPPAMPEDHQHHAHHSMPPRLSPEVPEHSTPDGHGNQVFHNLNIEAGTGFNDEHRGIGTWDIDGWLGSDDHKLVLKSEGERKDGKTKEADIQFLYSRNISTFWDVQAGIKLETRPQATTYAVLGMEGLAPYFLETEAHLFFSEDGNTSLHLRQETDLLLTQRLILQPFWELDAQAQDIPDRNTGAGLAHATAGLQLRYDITRRLAPFAEVEYGRKLGETAVIAHRNGRDTEETTVILGIRLGL